MKIFKWVIVILMVPVLLVGLMTYNNWRNLRLGYKESVGMYVINLNKSNIKLSSEDSVQFIGLKLHLESDGSFDLSHHVSYFADTFGSWEVDGYGMDRYILIKFPSGRVHQMDTCCSPDSTISISYPYSGQSSRYGFLAFERLETDKENH